LEINWLLSKPAYSWQYYPLLFVFKSAEMKKAYFIIFLSLMICLKADSQCTTGGAAWLSATNGTMNATGVIAGVNIVDVRTVGTMTSGRPNYSIGSSTWKGLNYASLWMSRAYSSFGSNYTSFTLQTPMDSNSIHLRVDNIRGDIFNWETQRVRGYNNGVAVLIDFKDPINGAFITGGNTINGASTTTSAVQSSMRAFFRSAVDSIVVQQVYNSDWIIAELMVQCEFILPINLSSFTAKDLYDAVRLEWKNSIESANLFYMEAERSADTRQWTIVEKKYPAGQGQLYASDDIYAVQGWNYYRLKYVYTDGRSEYTGILRLNREQDGIFQLAVFPNPAQSHITISFNASIHRAAIYDGQGRLVHQLRSFPGAQQVNTSQWKPGVYFLLMEKQNGERVFRKIFRQ
jgi:hypothetical protein